MQYVDVTSAQLWFYKEWDENDDELNQTFVLSELDHWDLGGSFEKNTVMAILETNIGGELSIPIPFANPPLSSVRTSRIRVAQRSSTARFRYSVLLHRTLPTHSPLPIGHDLAWEFHTDDEG